MDRLHAALPATAKKHVWNLKYGILNYPHFVAPEDVLRYLCPRMAALTSILDLGCGRGSLLRALRTQGWLGNYCGVDISKRAVNDAWKIGDQRSSWVVSDFESFRSPFSWDAITMVESLCYIKHNQLSAFLQDKIGMLKEQGFFLFRLHDLTKYPEYIDTVCRTYPQTERVGEHLFRVSANAQPLTH
jgi:predicted TPR repeat methyltransferase